MILINKKITVYRIKFTLLQRIYKHKFIIFVLFIIIV